MTLAGVFLRFFLAYVVLVVAAAVTFQLIGVPMNSGLNVAVLIGAVLWPCMAFATKNGRYFDEAEKKKVFWGMAAINLALQLLIGGGALAAQGKLSMGALLVAAAIVTVVHSIVIYYFIGAAGRMHAKQEAKRARADA